MIAIKTDIVENAIKTFKDELKNQQANALTELNNLRRNLPKRISPNVQDYLNKIIHLFSTENIITGNASFLENEKNNIGKVPMFKRKNFNFKDEILKCLGYTHLRSSFYPQYFMKIGIKACVYCNSQLTVSLEKGKDKASAKFQIDHYHSKSDYPFLSISLYNLYPVCASCNQAKSKNTVQFRLYEDIIKPSKYQFELETGCVAKYLSSKDKDINEINFTFIDPDKPTKKIVEYSFQDKFDIQGIYDSQKDIIEEMIVKAQIYTDSYKLQLINSFPKLFSKHGLSNRFFLGNYADPEDIHKRPMAKFMQDIARSKELKLL